MKRFITKHADVLGVLFLVLLYVIVSSLEFAWDVAPLQ